MWKVGEHFPSLLSLTPQEVSAHLLNDWLPAVPAGQGVAFMGWPDRLLINEYGRLNLSELVARTERQWKGVISWLLGIAGARAYLKADGYRWVAPVSAFFEDVVQPVNVPAWYLSFPKPALTTARLRPRVLCADYLAARSSGGSGPVRWAVVEAKGTKKQLSGSVGCDPKWQAQVRNLRISCDGASLVPDRYLVIATRVNSKGWDRELKIKAWNNETTQDDQAFSLALPDLVSGHLFGFYYGIGLLKVAQGISSSASRRSRGQKDLAPKAEFVNSIEDDGIRVDEVVRLGGGETSAFIELSEPLRRLTEKLVFLDHQDAAMKAIRIADEELDEWWKQNRISDQPNTVALPFGIRVKFIGGVG
jgi:hypothetical protein